MGVREGHSRPAALRVEEPGSASLQTDAALFSGERLQVDITVPLAFLVSQVSEREVPTSQARLPEITQEPAEASFETERTTGDNTVC